MKVYIVTEGLDYEEENIIIVYKSKEDAIKYIEDNYKDYIKSKDMLLWRYLTMFVSIYEKEVL